MRGFGGHRLLFRLPTKHLFPCAQLLRERKGDREREEVKMERSRKSQDEGDWSGFA